jgi:intracellular sulfur oxidation DsrE/DsrF family protein
VISSLGDLMALTVKEEKISSGQKLKWLTLENGPLVQMSGNSLRATSVTHDMVLEHVKYVRTAVHNVLNYMAISVLHLRCVCLDMYLYHGPFTAMKSTWC